MLSCPVCGALVHADELKRLAAQAQTAAPADALALWRQALALLPRDSEQFKLVAAKVETISKGLETNPQSPAKSGGGKWKGAAGGGVLLMLLAKGKFLLLGLTKLTTLFTMLATLGIYWQFYGWQLVLGLILCVYVHEMGHVFALKRMGISATAPMFIPGFGALILLKQQYFSPREDARIGLAGPIWGLAASVVAALLGFALRSPTCFVIAQWNAWINLANLMPVWSLDGARGYHALRRNDRILAAMIFVGSWFPVIARGNLGHAMPFISAATSIYGILRKNEPETTDQRAFWEYAGLCLTLMAFNWLPAPSPV